MFLRWDNRLYGGGEEVLLLNYIVGISKVHGGGHGEDGGGPAAPAKASI